MIARTKLGDSVPSFIYVNGGNRLLKECVDAKLEFDMDIVFYYYTILLLNTKIINFFISSMRIFKLSMMVVGDFCVD